MKTKHEIKTNGTENKHKNKYQRYAMNENHVGMILKQWSNVRIRFIFKH